MAVGTFSYLNSSGYTERLSNPDDYRTYNMSIRNGTVENRTNASVTLYSEPDGRGDAYYLNSNTNTYLSRGYQSCRFTS